LQVRVLLEEQNSVSSKTARLEDSAAMKQPPVQDNRILLEELFV
jgi:hypothetical protein